MKIVELAKENIYYPIKLEYYKIYKNKKIEDTTYGIEIVKKTYKDKQIEIEQEEILNITTSEEKIEKLLELLKKYQVTPIIVKDIIEDLKNKFIFNM